jgi:hypothetical protein
MTTRCHICAEPMTVDIEPNEFFTAEKIHAIATCPKCCKARGDYRPADKPKEPRQVSLPYADN